MHVADNSTTPCGACDSPTVSGHHFSRDGITWHASDVEPYPNHYELYSQASGIQTVHVSTRERPKLIFDSKGEISHLVTGTCEARTCPPIPPVNCKYSVSSNVLTLLVALHTGH